MTAKEKLIKQIINSKPVNQTDFLHRTRKICNQLGITSPSNATLLSTYRQLLNNGKIKANQVLEQALVKGPIRTLSGVSVITVLTKPWPCPGHCLYCPAERRCPKVIFPMNPLPTRRPFTI
jgi:elongator complex protein 3